MEQYGFKALNKQMMNQYGNKFEEHTTYSIPNNIELTKGPMGTGWHFTPYLEDTLRYVDGMTKNIKIVKVIARKEIITFDDEYNGYYDISATREITIEHILTRKEIINYMLHRPTPAMIRFISGYKLKEEEIALIKESFHHNLNISLAIEYYQKDNKEVYNKIYQLKR